MPKANCEIPTTARDGPVQLRKGLDIALAGTPRQVIETGPAVSSAALVGDDYVGLRPKLLVEQGDRVRLGEPLFADRRDPRIVFTAFGSGTVAAVNLGEKRSLRSVVLSLDSDGGDPLRQRATMTLSSPSGYRAREPASCTGLVRWVCISLSRTRMMG